MAIKFINKAEEPTHKIEIFGEIGESFWSEGITLESFANDLKQAENKPLNILINSLGGDVDTAFAIHDLIRAYPNSKKVQIIGMTASSGINIAMAGDTVEMSKNALALIHNASTGMQGNADEHRRTAEDLDKVDQIIVNIYNKKSGQPKSKFWTAMEKEAWLSADEMKELGLIDKVIEPEKINNSVYEKINNSNLPKIKNDMEKTFMESITNMVTEIKNLIVGKKEETLAIDMVEITNKIAAVEAHVAELVVENESLTEKISNHAAEIETLNTAHKTVVENLQKEFSAFAQLNASTVTFNEAGIVIEPHAGKPTEEDKKTQDSVNALKNMATFKKSGIKLDKE